MTLTGVFHAMETGVRQFCEPRSDGARTEMMIIHGCPRLSLFSADHLACSLLEHRTPQLMADQGPSSPILGRCSLYHLGLIVRLSSGTAGFVTE